MAHITGGGLPGNVPRVLPAGVECHIDSSAWSHPAIFAWLQSHGNVAPSEMRSTFNCGIGMVLIVARENVSNAKQILESSGETVYELGEIKNGAAGVVFD